MGMYTEFHFNVELRKDTPEEVLCVLRYMVGGDANLATSPPSHALFETERWVSMLMSDSYYFPADTCSTLRSDDIAGTHYLCIRCNLKDYGGEIKAFVSWIDPYVEAFDGDFLGFSRYEESEDPTVIRKETQHNVPA